MPWKGFLVVFLLFSVEGLRVNRGKDAGYCVLLDPAQGREKGWTVAWGIKAVQGRHGVQRQRILEVGN